jgi:hypothetical protein
MDELTQALATWYAKRNAFDKAERTRERAGEDLADAERELAALCVARGITPAALKQPAAAAGVSQPGMQSPNGGAAYPGYPNDADAGAVVMEEMQRMQRGGGLG